MSSPVPSITKVNFTFFHVAKCNLGKVNLELMLPAVSPSLHMIRGGAPLEFAGANYVQPCLLAIVAITASVSESLWIKVQWQTVIASSPFLFPPLAFVSVFTCYLRMTFHIFLNGQITCRLSGPSCPPLVQWHPYPLVPHDLSQPSIPTLQSHMLSFSPASLSSSPSCPAQPQRP